MVEEITMREILNGKEGVVKINYTKMKEKIRRCAEDKLNQKCRRELEDMGVNFIDG